MLKCIVLAAALSAPLLSAQAQAHPHAFIDFKVELVFDPAGRLTALRETWLFDEAYTAFSTEGFPNDTRKYQSKLDALSAENLANLRDYDYFTRVEAGGRKLAFGKATEAKTRQVDKRLEMSFLVPLSQPLAMGAGAVTYAVYDPPYYTEMLHAESDDAIRLLNAPAGCRHRMVPPEPPAEAVGLARALDRTQSAGDSLGANFAEKVEIRCGE